MIVCDGCKHFTVCGDVRRTIKCNEREDQMFISRGDVNFFDGGILIRPLNDNEYEVITCYPDGDKENNYLLTCGYVDITDSSIDSHDVCSYAGLRDYSIDYTDDENQLFVAAIVSYYGNSLYDITQEWKTKNEIIDEIERDYINLIEWDYYEKNFFERNCVVETFDEYHQKDEQVYNSLSDALEEFEKRARNGWSITVLSK